MVKILIVGGCLDYGQRGRIGLIAGILRARGHEVDLIVEPEPIIPVPVPPAVRIEQYVDKIDLYDFRQERDYPTLREGLRNPRIRDRRFK